MKFKSMFLACLTAAICSHVQAAQRPHRVQGGALAAVVVPVVAAPAAGAPVTPPRPTRPASTNAPKAERKR